MVKEVFNKIIEDLDKVKVFLENSKNTGKLPDIERDIILSKLRVIYEFIQIYQPDYVPDKEQALVKKIISEETHSVSKAPIESKKTEVVSTPKEEPQTTKTISEPVKKQTTEPEIKIIEAEKPAPVSHKATPPVEKPKEVTTPEGNLLNDIFSKGADTFDISQKFKNAPISDIFSYIGINDKFLFIKELFNNDSVLYKSTIETLNQAQDFNAAVQYLDTHFKWDIEDPTVQSLLELVRRRHPIS
jgi:hypothetical protein